MNRKNLHDSISKIVPERPEGPPADLGQEPGLRRELGNGSAYSQFRSKKVTFSLNGQAYKRLELAAWRLGYQKPYPVLKAICEAAAGIEAGDFYDLLAAIRAEVKKSQDQGGQPANS